MFERAAGAASLWLSGGMLAMRMAPIPHQPQHLAWQDLSRVDRTFFFQLVVVLACQVPDQTQESGKLPAKRQEIISFLLCSFCSKSPSPFLLI